jgi:hypothetical protein
MMNKKLKRKRKLAGRMVCHGNTTNCKTEHAILTKKTKKGTKPAKKIKKVYSKKKITDKEIRQAFKALKKAKQLPIVNGNILFTIYYKACP